jgi:putative ABC transport system permease protein
VTFLGLLAHNVWRRRLRAVVTAVAVAIGVTAVLALGVLTSSLRDTAVSVLQLGKADFTVSQKGASDILYSTISKQEIDAMGATKGVASAIGVFVHTGKINAEHPFFLEVGMLPADEAPYGVQVVAGRSFTKTANNEIMIGWRAAKDYGIGVGGKFKIEERTFRVVGIFSTNVSIADEGGMFPLAELQAWHTLPGVYTLAVVRVDPHASVPAVRRRMEKENPRLATVKSQSEFGRVDRNLVLITAANVGGSILALFIGATGVMNTSLLSFYERIREFGLLRAAGWNRRRLFGLVIGEALFVSLIGAGAGIGIGFGAVALLARLPDLRGVFHPVYHTAIFGRALGFAFGMAVLGALYPAIQAARLSPLVALQHE